MNTAKKPWPSDAVMIVCAIPEKANKAAMDSVNQGTCRECLCDVLYDGFSFDRASRIADLHNRPVRFFCEECHKKFDIMQCDLVEDHTRHKDGIVLQSGNFVKEGKE
jgi:uncharacterized protein YlaI